MKYILAALLLTFFITAPTQAQTLEHSVGSTIADSLMVEWTRMWNSDDLDAISDLYANDVVLHADTSSQGLIGKPSVLNATSVRMEETGALKIEPDHSFQRGDISYQTGRFLINRETGAYSFIFHHKVDRGWKLKYTYYLHDKLVESSK